MSTTAHRTRPSTSPPRSPATAREPSGSPTSPGRRTAAASPTRAATTPATTASGSSTPTGPRPSRWRSAGPAPSGTRPGPRTARRSPTRWSKTRRNRSTSPPRPGGIGQPLANGVGHEPTWSPERLEDRLRRLPLGRLRLRRPPRRRADGSGTPLIVPPSPYTEWTFNAWSPDGGRIAYRATAASGATVYRVMNADGSGDHPLASPGEGDARYASWSPDGSRVVYEGALLGNITARNLYIANTDGSGGAQPLTSDGKSKHPAWRVVSSTPQAPPPHPGAEKPKVVWITKRIFVEPAAGRSTSPATSATRPSCSVSTEGKTKGSMVAGLRFRPATRRRSPSQARQEETAQMGRRSASGKTTDPRRGDPQDRRSASTRPVSPSSSSAARRRSR